MPLSRGASNLLPKPMDMDFDLLLHLLDVCRHPQCPLQAHGPRASCPDQGMMCAGNSSGHI
jgi:hypothetical protein